MTPSVSKLFLHIVVSVDGYIAGQNRDFAWHPIDADVEDYINSLLHSIDGMFFGRVAFQELAQYWPDALTNTGTAVSGGDPAPNAVTARLMHDLPKYAVSNTLRTANWHNSHIIGGDIAAAVDRIKREASRDLALFAGAQTAQSFARLGLIDEYRLLIGPSLLGGGIRLFDEGISARRLRWLSTRTFASGATLLVYRPASE